MSVFCMPMPELVFCMPMPELASLCPPSASFALPVVIASSTPASVRRESLISVIKMHDHDYDNVLRSAVEYCSVLQCVAVCCSVLQCVAVCYVVLQCAAVCYSLLRRVAVCCSGLQWVAVRYSVWQRNVYTTTTVCCRVLQRAAVCHSVLQCVAKGWINDHDNNSVFDCVAVWCRYCSVLQWFAVCCSVLNCVAVWCSTAKGRLHDHDYKHIYKHDYFCDCSHLYHYNHSTALWYRGKAI